VEKIISESKQEAEQASNGNTLGREGTVPVLCVLTLVLTVCFDCVFLTVCFDFCFFDFCFFDFYIFFTFFFAKYDV